MTALTQKTTRVAEALASLIDQFKEQPVIEAIIRAAGTQDQELEDAAFEVIIETKLAAAVGEQLDGIGSVVGVDRAGRNDADYRVRIGAQISLNSTSGQIEEIIALVVALGGGNLDVLEIYPAAFEIESNDIVTNGLEIGAVVQASKPAAVAATFTFFEAVPVFLFGVAGQGFDDGKMGGIVP